MDNSITVLNSVGIKKNSSCLYMQVWDVKGLCYDKGHRFAVECTAERKIGAHTHVAVCCKQGMHPQHTWTCTPASSPSVSLCVAAFKGHMDVVRYLVEKQGCDPTVVTLVSE